MKARNCSSTSVARPRYPSTNVVSDGKSIPLHCGTTAAPSTTPSPTTGPTGELWNGPQSLGTSPFDEHVSPVRALSGAMTSGIRRSRSRSLLSPLD